MTTTTHDEPSFYGSMHFTKDWDELTLTEQFLYMLVTHQALVKRVYGDEWAEHICNLLPNENIFCSSTRGIKMLTVSCTGKQGDK